MLCIPPIHLQKLAVNLLKSTNEEIKIIKKINFDKKKLLFDLKDMALKYELLKSEHE